MTLPLADVRIIAVEQYGAGLGHAAARGPRRRGHQDRGSRPRRRRRPLRAAVPGGRGLALLRDLQPQQEERLAGPAHAGGREVFEHLVAQRRRGLLQPARRPAGQAAADLRRPARRQPADRLLLAVGLRDDGPAGRRGRLRLHHPGHGRVDEPHRRPGGPADQERPVARRPLAAATFGDRAAGRPVARAPRRRRLRLRHLALRDRAAPADVHRDVGGHRGLQAAAHARSRRTRRSSLSRPSRPPTAGSRSPARSRSSGSCCAGRWTGGPAADPRFADFAARDQHRDELLPTLRAAFARAHDRRVAGGPRRGRRPTDRSTTSPRRSRTRRSRRARTSSRSSIPRSGPSARSPRRCASSGEPNPLRRAPHRGEHTDDGAAPSSAATRRPRSPSCAPAGVG